MTLALPAAPSSAATPRVRRLAKAGAGWLIPAALVALWQVSSSLGFLSEGVLPSPLAVLQAGWRRPGQRPNCPIGDSVATILARHDHGEDRDRDHHARKGCHEGW